MRRRPTRSTRTEPRCPYTTLFRSGDACSCALRSRQQHQQLLDGRIHRIGAGRDMIEIDIGGGEIRVAEKALHLLQRVAQDQPIRSEEHTSELQSLMRISYAVFCLKKKKQILHITYNFF